MNRMLAVAASIAALAVGTPGQVPTGPTGANPIPPLLVGGPETPASGKRADSPSPKSDKKPLVAVMAFEARQVGDDEAQILAEAIAAEMARSGEIRLMERSQMDKILAEQGFQNSGACSGTECAVEVGQILGIDRMVVGSIGHIGRTYVLSARTVSVATGEVIRSSSRQAQGEIDQILTTLVPQVAMELLGRAMESKIVNPVPVAQFSAPPPPEVWSDSLVVVWQVSDDKSLASVNLGVARIDRPDSIIARDFRVARGTLASGSSLLRFPKRMDSGTYVLKITAEDDENAKGSSQVYFQRKLRIAKSGSGWGWWLAGGLLVGGGAGGAYFLSQQDNGSEPTTAKNRSFVVTW